MTLKWVLVLCVLFELFIFSRFYLFERERAQAAGADEGGSGGGEGKGEVYSQLGRELYSGLHPRTLRSPPELKADS